MSARLAIWPSFHEAPSYENEEANDGTQDQREGQGGFLNPRDEILITEMHSRRPLISNAYLGLSMHAPSLRSRQI